MNEADQIKAIFAGNLKNLMRQHKINQQQLSVIAGVSQQSVSNWLNCKQIPRMGIVQKLADYFDVSKAELLENHKESNDFAFTNAEEAIRFILEQPLVANYGGYNLDIMSNEEIIEFANDVAEMIGVLSKRFK